MSDEADAVTKSRQKECGYSKGHKWLPRQGQATRCVHCGVSTASWEEMQLDDAMTMPFGNIGTWGNHP